MAAYAPTQASAPGQRVHVDFQTAVARAEVEERPHPGALHAIEFGVEGMALRFVIDLEPAVERSSAE